MRIDEIELVNSQHFPSGNVREYLDSALPDGMLDQFIVWRYESGNHRFICLTDDNKNLAAFALFEIRLGGNVWQARTAQSYSPYQGQGLVGKLYKLVKERYKKSIQSDTEQSLDAKKLWTKTLPGLGLHPMVFDTKTEMIIDPQNFDMSLMYPQKDTGTMQWRYTWIMEKFDHYPSQNLLTEGKLNFPVTGLWYNFKENI